MDEGSQLKVSSLLYDAEGNVILDADQVLDGYTSVCWGLNEIPGGEYSLVSVSFVESEGKALYTIEGRSNLNTLVLRNNSDLSFNSKSSLLGIAFQTITIGNEDTVKVALTPASAYVGVQYQKAAPISEPDNTTVIFTMTANMTVDFKEGQPMYSDPGIISVQVNPGDYKSYFVLPSELLNSLMRESFVSAGSLCLIPMMTEVILTWILPCPFSRSRTLNFIYYICRNL